MHCIVWSSLGVVFLGRPLLFRSQNVPSMLNFSMALRTAVLDKRNLVHIVRSEYPSLCRVTICAL